MYFKQEGNIFFLSGQPLKSVVEGDPKTPYWIAATKNNKP